MISRAERAMSFGAIAEDYDRLRPGPAAAAVDWLLPAGTAGRPPVVVDLGAGTGLLSRALASRGARVVAVEPDERMRAVLAARSPGVRAVAGRGEQIPLPDASADGVCVSSAWHWMDPELAVPEITRVLRDGGRFGVIWTSRDRESTWIDGPSERSGLSNERGQAGPRNGRHEVALPDGVPLRDAAMASFPFTRLMDAETLIEWLGTYSRVITASEQDRAVYFARVRVVLAEHFPGAAEIDVPMLSLCWRADRAAR
jgi:SAM-dependent methyltransferase